MRCSAISRARSRAEGFKVAGLIQRNGDVGDACACVMELIDLGSGDAIRISQELGAGSSSCRVDPRRHRRGRLPAAGIPGKQAGSGRRQ